MLKVLDFAKKSIAIDDYDGARNALLQAQALAKLMAANGNTVDDPECICVTAGVLEELLERVEKHLEGATGA